MSAHSAYLICLFINDRTAQGQHFGAKQQAVIFQYLFIYQDSIVNLKVPLVRASYLLLEFLLFAHFLLQVAELFLSLLQLRFQLQNLVSQEAVVWPCAKALSPTHRKRDVQNKKTPPTHHESS